MPFVKIPKGHIATGLLQNLHSVEEARGEIDPFLIDEHPFAWFIVNKIQASLLHLHKNRSVSLSFRDRK